MSGACVMYYPLPRVDDCRMALGIGISGEATLRSCVISPCEDTHVSTCLPTRLLPTAFTTRGGSGCLSPHPHIPVLLTPSMLGAAAAQNMYHETETGMQLPSPSNCRNTSPCSLLPCQSV